MHGCSQPLNVFHFANNVKLMFRQKNLVICDLEIIQFFSFSSQAVLEIVHSTSVTTGFANPEWLFFCLWHRGVICENINIPRELRPT
jgi:hypothetical protein